MQPEAKTVASYLIFEVDMNQIFWAALICTTLAAATLDSYTIGQQPLAIDDAEFRQVYSEIAQRAEVNGREKRAQPYFCNLRAINITIYNGNGCSAVVPNFGCFGKCQTQEIPHFYQSRLAYLLDIAN